MTPPGDGAAFDTAAAMARGLAALAAAGSAGQGTTSDLSIDEVLLLHSAGWEPVDLVYGVSVVSVPPYVWNWGSGEISAASEAHAVAFRTAVARMRREGAAVGGQGVVGVSVEVEVEPHHVAVTLAGSAVRPTERSAGRHGQGQPFVSDLSARDFTLLGAAGWAPVGLAFGASFVYAPRRSAKTAMTQANQNVELTNFTEAMYASREAAMDRMQRDALGAQAHGVVAVQVREGPMPFAHHAIGFTTWGTAVRLQEAAHRPVRPQMVLSVDDAEVAFAAESLRGAT